MQYPPENKKENEVQEGALIVRKAIMCTKNNNKYGCIIKKHRLNVTKRQRVKRLTLELARASSFDGDVPQ